MNMKAEKLKLTPTKEEIRSLRLVVGLTQQAASELTLVSLSLWKKLEAGTIAMHPAYMSFFKHRINNEICKAYFE